MSTPPTLHKEDAAWLFNEDQTKQGKDGTLVISLVNGKDKETVLDVEVSYQQLSSLIAYLRAIRDRWQWKAVYLSVQHREDTTNQ
jgi:hypothetical protein